MLAMLDVIVIGGGILIAAFLLFNMVKTTFGKGKE
jgi:hypothetical protein